MTESGPHRGGPLLRPLYALYSRQVRRRLDPQRLPRHVGVVIDGNRRWARSTGYADPREGHRVGADHVIDLLHWCTVLGIGHVTVYLCSEENLQKRGDAEVSALMSRIETTFTRAFLSGDDPPPWKVVLAGDLSMLPTSTSAVLLDTVAATRSQSATLTLAIGYGGRQEIMRAMRTLLLDRAAGGSTLAEVADSMTMDDIADRLDTAGQPEPDLIIRTSGEQRLSNFLLWQSAYSELYFCDAYWPAVREIDFLRALRSYAGRERRYGA